MHPNGLHLKGKGKKWKDWGQILEAHIKDRIIKCEYSFKLIVIFFLL